MIFENLGSSCYEPDFCIKCPLTSVPLKVPVATAWELPANWLKALCSLVESLVYSNRITMHLIAEFTNSMTTSRPHSKMALAYVTILLGGLLKKIRALVIAVDFVRDLSWITEICVYLRCIGAKNYCEKYLFHFFRF